MRLLRIRVQNYKVIDRVPDKAPDDTNWVPINNKVTSLVGVNELSAVYKKCLLKRVGLSVIDIQGATYSATVHPQVPRARM